MVLGPRGSPLRRCLPSTVPAGRQDAHSTHAVGADGWPGPEGRSSNLVRAVLPALAWGCPRGQLHPSTRNCFPQRWSKKGWGEEPHPRAQEVGWGRQARCVRVRVSVSVYPSAYPCPCVHRSVRDSLGPAPGPRSCSSHSTLLLRTQFPASLPPLCQDILGGDALIHGVPPPPRLGCARGAGHTCLLVGCAAGCPS